MQFALLVVSLETMLQINQSIFSEIIQTWQKIYTFPHFGSSITQRSTNKKSLVMHFLVSLFIEFLQYRESLKAKKKGTVWRNIHPVSKA
jgi:glycopeptide antibiotics resistance protein